MISRYYLSVVALSLISFAVGSFFLYLVYQTLKGIWLLPWLFCWGFAYVLALGARRIYLEENYVRKEDLVDSEEQIEHADQDE